MTGKFKRWKVTMMVESSDTATAEDIIKDLDTTFYDIVDPKVEFVEIFEEEY